MTRSRYPRCAYPGYDLAWAPAYGASIHEGGHDVMQSPASGIPVRRRIERMTAIHVRWLDLQPLKEPLN